MVINSINTSINHLTGVTFDQQLSVQLLLKIINSRVSLIVVCCFGNKSIGIDDVVFLNT